MFRFETVSPESLGIPSESLLAFIEKEKEHSIEMHSLQILRHQKRCLEAYWAPYNRDAAHILFSFSKSLTSTAVGFAEQEGLLSLDEKLVDIFPDESPENPSDNLKEADIWSLLTMTCGHADEIRDRSADWIRAFLAHEFTYKPGTTYQYNTAGTNLLAAIVRKRSGLNVTEYLKPRLLDKIGIPPISCVKLADGTDMGGAGMYLTPESMARFAQFVLQKGCWEGEQLLNAGWFERAGAKQVETVSEVYKTDWREWMQGYGFQFWRCTWPDSFRADGAFGQFAVILPNEDAAIVVNSASSDANTLLVDLFDTIVPAMQENPLPENPEALGKLRALEASVEIPVLWGIRNRDSERKLKGKCFTAEKELPSFAAIMGGAGSPIKDEGHLQSLGFSFEESSVKVSVVQDNGAFDLTASFAGTMCLQTLCGCEAAFSARWAAADTLVIETRCTSAATGTRLIFTFDEAGLSISARSSIPAGAGLMDSLAQETLRMKG